MSQAQVNANFCSNRSLCVNLIGAKHRHEETARTVLADSNRRDLGRLRDGARKSDIERIIHLGNTQRTAIPFKGAGSVFGRLSTILFLECRVLVAAREEVAERGLQVAKRLLNRYAGHFIQPRKVRLLLERGQHGRCFVVSDFLLTLKPRISSLAKHVVVSKTSAAERLGKSLFLLWRRVKPELVCALRFHLHIIQQSCKDSNNKERRAGIGLALQAALSIPGLKAGVSRAFG